VSPTSSPSTVNPTQQLSKSPLQAPHVHHLHHQVL
jgi:hypothetical protein